MLATACSSEAGSLRPDLAEGRLGARGADAGQRSDDFARGLPGMEPLPRRGTLQLDRLAPSPSLRLPLAVRTPWRAGTWVAGPSALAAAASLPTTVSPLWLAHPWTPWATSSARAPHLPLTGRT